MDNKGFRGTIRESEREKPYFDESIVRIRNIAWFIKFARPGDILKLDRKINGEGEYKPKGLKVCKDKSSPPRSNLLTWLIIIVVQVALGLMLAKGFANVWK